MKNSTIKAFFALVRGGLWEQEVRLSSFGEINFKEIYRLAEEQSVMGLVAAGLEHVADVKLHKEEVLQFVGRTLQIEQQNKAMNSFIAKLTEGLRKADVYTLLLKGQGTSQCYERPLWRSSGDVDLFLSDGNYHKAKEFLLPLSSSREPEGAYEKHFGMTIDSWVVELHGTLRSGLSRKIDKGLDAVMDNVFMGGNVRSWTNDRTQIFLLSAENDAIYIFTHILQHFFKGGIGLRQICDWCRLLWRYQTKLNLKFVETKIRQMGLMSEWKTFGALAVEYIGMPSNAMPFYSNKKKWHNRAESTCSFIMKVGNFGYNRDMSYFSTKPYFVRKTISLRRRIGDLVNHFCIFPMDTLRFTPRIIINGLKSAANGE